MKHKWTAGTAIAAAAALIGVLAWLGIRPPYTKIEEHQEFVASAGQVHDGLTMTIGDVAEQVAGNSKAVLVINRDAAQRAVWAAEDRIDRLKKESRDTTDARDRKRDLELQLKKANDALEGRR